MSPANHDEEIERRLRAIGRAATPMPASMCRKMGQLPEG